MSGFTSFSEFYPYYLTEHGNRSCRRMHFIGSSLVIVVLLVALLTGQLGWLWLMPVAGYGCAWIGHFFIEHNRPATFKYPLWSFAGDYHMFFLWLTGRLAKRRARILP